MAASAPLPLAQAARRAPSRSRVRLLAALALVLIIAFAKPLYDLTDFALHSALYSHILLIPFVSLYLVWLERRRLAADSKPARRLAAVPLLAGCGLIAGYWLAVAAGWKPKTEDYLVLMMLAFLSFLLSGCFFVLGTKTLRTIAFPLAFLISMVPFPYVVGRWLESFLQQGSAEAAYLFLKLSGMPLYRDGTVFQLPGFSLEVAPQCSGIHSSLVLFITSLLAGYLLLRGRWARTILVLAVIPLGMLRNGFRICLLGHLCVRISPDWIHSDLHRRGGPIFFVLSLVPLFLLLWYLRKRELRRNRQLSCAL